jgi:hypothetical protein
MGRTILDRAGTGNIGHCMPDAGAFSYEAGGERVISDGGRSYKKMTAQQNTILVDGLGQWGDGFVWHPKITTDQAGTIAYFFASDEYVHATGDATRAYPPERGLERFRRDLVYALDRYVVIHDELRSAAASAYSWLAHTFGEIAERAPGRYTFARDGAEVDLHVVAPAEYSPTVDTTDIVVQYRHRGGFARHLKLDTPAEPLTEYLVVLAPPEARPLVVEPASGEGFTGVKMATDEGDLYAAFSPTGGGIELAGIKTYARSAVVWRPKLGRGWVGLAEGAEFEYDPGLWPQGHPRLIDASNSAG